MTGHAAQWKAMNIQITIASSDDSSCPPEVVQTFQDSWQEGGCTGALAISFLTWPVSRALPLTSTNPHPLLYGRWKIQAVNSNWTPIWRPPRIDPKSYKMISWSFWTLIGSRIFHAWSTALFGSIQRWIKLGYWVRSLIAGKISWANSKQTQVLHSCNMYMHMCADWPDWWEIPELTIDMQLLIKLGGGIFPQYRKGTANKQELFMKPQPDNRDHLLCARLRTLCG